MTQNVYLQNSTLVYPDAKQHSLQLSIHKINTLTDKIRNEENMWATGHLKVNKFHIEGHQSQNLALLENAWQTMKL